MLKTDHDLIMIKEARFTPSLSNFSNPCSEIVIRYSIFLQKK